MCLSFSYPYDDTLVTSTIPMNGMHTNDFWFEEKQKTAHECRRGLWLSLDFAFQFEEEEPFLT